MAQPNMTQAEALQIRKEQVYLLYKPSLHAAFATVFTSCFLAYIQWDMIAQDVLLLWLGVTWLIIIARITYYFAFTRQQPTAQEIPFWEKSYVVISIAIGLAWGSAGVFLFPENNFEYQAATIVVLAGMAAGSVTTLSALRAPVYIFLFLCMSPLIIHLSLEMTPISVSFAFMCLGYLLFLSNAARHLYQTHLQNISTRVQSLDREQSLKYSEQMMQETSHILEMIAKGQPVTQIYDAINLLYESRHPHIKCSILELHGTTLKHGSAPNLPQAYCQAIDGVEIGENVGSCGTSTYTGKRVLTENIATDPKWNKFRDIALSFHLKSCWSEPVKDAQGKALGSFAIYSDTPSLPSQEQLHDLEAAARLTGIVMEREQRKALLQKLHSAFEYAQDAIMITDLEARIEYVNPSFEAMTGYCAKDSVGKFTTILRSPKHSEDFYIRFYQHCRQGKPWQGEITIQCKDGSLLETERNVSPVLNEHGDIMYFVAIMRDLTDKKLLEKQFQQAQKMRAIGTLVGGIAHDFNNILAGVVGNLYLLKKKITDNPDALQKVERVEQLSTRATHLIQQLLTFARKDAVNMEPVELVPLIKDAFTFLRTSIPENIDMQLQVHSKHLHVYGNATLIHQMLLNLVNNAHDALETTGNPSITITADTFTPDTTFMQQHQYFKMQPYAHISVADNGCGILASDIENIFEPFFTTKEVGKGTGLGLSMVYGAIKSHQGYIEVDSDEGQGSVFHMYLPLLETETKAPAHLPNNTNTTKLGRGETILLVDDDDHIRDMGKEVLEELGYQVLQAADGLEAVDVFQAHQTEIALVITDIVMPKLGGADMAEQIRMLQPDMQVIFSTGYDKTTAQTASNVASDDIVLSKPYNIDELSHIIRKKLQS